MKGKLESGLLNSIVDFLKDRKFAVKVEKAMSKEVILDRGCVQGSVLGPSLFSLYGGELLEKIQSQGAWITTYADDSYVIVEADTFEDLQVNLTRTIKTHYEYLTELGMVVNQTKTEVMIMNNRRQIPQKIILGGVETEVRKEMKVLGVTFDNTLHWDQQVENVTKKAQQMISGLRTIRPKLTEDQFIRLSTAQYYGTIYYRIQTWLSKANIKKHTDRLSVLHYKLLRLAVGDWRREFPRAMLDTLGRAKPKEYANYSIASLMIKCQQEKKPERLYHMSIRNQFFTRRGNVAPKYFDSSRTRVGSQAIWNRISHITGNLPETWSKERSKDALRVYLKKNILDKQ